MELPELLAPRDQQELHDLYLVMWHENKNSFSSLTSVMRWFIVFKEWVRRRDADT